MRKDIFIDNNLTKNFANPADSHYKELIKWLMHYDEEDIKKNNNLNEYAHLVVSQSLLNEYLRSSYNCAQMTSIPIIISKLTREGRLLIKTKQEIEKFKNDFFTNAVKRRLRSNYEDHNHIVVVLLSDRKFALTFDNNFTSDLKSFRRYNITVADCPSKLNYK